jgi:hypothetical protein
MNKKISDELHAFLNEGLNDSNNEDNHNNPNEELIQEHIKIRKLFNNIIYYYNYDLHNKNKNKTLCILNTTQQILLLYDSATDLKIRFKNLNFNNPEDPTNLYGVMVDINKIFLKNLFYKLYVKTFDRFNVETFDKNNTVFININMGFTKNFRAIPRFLKHKFPTIKFLILDSKDKNTFKINENNTTITVNPYFFLPFKPYIGINKAREFILNVLTNNQINLFNNLEVKDTNNELQEHIIFPKSSLNHTIKTITNNLKKINQNIDKETRNEIFKLYNTVEVKTLNDFITQYQKSIDYNNKEAYWQNLFDKNKFILKMLFPYPVISLNREYSIIGRNLENKRILDFIGKNKFTNQACIIELKKPNTKLVTASTHRTNLYNISTDFTQSVNQVNDQIYTLYSSNINSDYKTYNIQGVLIIGTIKSINNNDDKKKTFELYRNSFKNIQIITFDEILEKLKDLQELFNNKNNT